MEVADVEIDHLSRGGWGGIPPHSVVEVRS
jgi:hypothetical protein